MPLMFNKDIGTMESYSKYWSHCEGEKKYFLEASPSYIYGREVIASRIQKELGDQVKIILILRNPADRLYSFYQRKRANTYLDSNITFKTFVEESVKLSNTEMSEQRDDEEAILTRGIREGFYIEYLPPWFEKFGDNLKILFFEDLKRDASSFMKGLCKWLELDFSVYSPNDFSIENQTIRYRNRWLHKTLLSVNKKFESFWRKNIRFKRFLRSLYKGVNEGDQKSERMSDEDRNNLSQIYSPYNKRLSEFLKGKGIKQLPDWLS